jgi:hypothetical protein
MARGSLILFTSSGFEILESRFDGGFEATVIPICAISSDVLARDFGRVFLPSSA